MFRQSGIICFFFFYSVSYAQCSPCLLSSSPVLSGIANFVLLHVFKILVLCVMSATIAA